MEGTLETRDAAIDMAPDEFRALGHKLVDRIADFMATMPAGKVTPGETPAQVRAALGSTKGFPSRGASRARCWTKRANSCLTTHCLLGTRGLWALSPRRPRLSGRWPICWRPR